MIKIVRPLRSGQITIPIAFRRKLGIDTNTALQVILKGEELRIRPIRLLEKELSWFKKLHQLFSPVRKRVGKHSSKEINRQINLALKEVRGEV